jgi:L-rhamnose-H+ transport protein
MLLLTGCVLVIFAGLLQGTFILPMTLVKEWAWEHTWATFSLLGMLVLNWIITLLLLPNIFEIYRIAPSRDLAVLALFGIGWGAGAVLFGLGMDRLGMALGYPIIMGLIAGLGAVVPLLIFFPSTLITTKGSVLLAGTALVVFGILLCSIAGSRRAPAGKSLATTNSSAFKTGLAIAVLAGTLSCLPNIGMAFAGNLTRAAETLGISNDSSGNSVWALLFTMGSVVNLAYCLYLMVSNNTLHQYWNRETARNIGLSSLMALMWIGSFYLYGVGAAKLGRWGVVVGWPLFISISIVVGNICGLLRGEWRNVPAAARKSLNQGLAVLVVAVIVVALSNSF